MKKEIEEELREISPFLAGLKKEIPDKEPFRTPKYYFDTLADKVIEKAETKTHTIPPPQYAERPNWFEGLQQWMAAWLQPRYALAFATITILAIYGWFIMQKQQPSDLNFATSEEIQEYIQENIDDFDLELIQEHGALADVEPKDNATEQELFGKDLENLNISDEEIELYLKENMSGDDLKYIENNL